MTIEGARFTEMGAIKPAFVLLRLRPLVSEQFGIMDSRYGSSRVSGRGQSRELGTAQQTTRIEAIAGPFDATKRPFDILHSERTASVMVPCLGLSGLADACDRLPSGGIAAGGWSVCPEGSFRSGHLPMPAAGMSCENARHRSAPVPPAKRGRFGTAAEASVRCTGLALKVSRVPKGHVAMVGDAFNHGIN